MNSLNLKWIALITMIIDHIGAVFFPKNLIFRYVGRLAFPIYSFLISQGCEKTRDLKKYLTRLFIFALISEPFFDLTFYGKINIFKQNNTIFTLFFASLVIYILKLNISKVIKIFSVFLVLFLVENIGTDYGIWGILLILAFYFSPSLSLGVILASILIVFKDFSYFLFYFIETKHIYLPNVILNLMTLVPLCFIYKYNNEKGKSLKYLFYWAYPLHFLLILIIKLILI